MIDTVNFFYSVSPSQVFLQPSRKNPHKRIVYSEWPTKVAKLSDMVPLPPILEKKLQAAHIDKSDLRIKLHKNGRLLVAGSLPKMLYGTNSILIRDQSEINRALECIDLILRKKGFLFRGRPDFQRVDLVWHFPQLSYPTLFAHFATTHQDLAGQVVNLYRRGGRFTGVTWTGAEMTINMYDKIAEGEVSGQGRPSPSPYFMRRYLRMEVQLLKPGKLKRVFGRSIQSLKLTECYQIYRKILLRFEKPNEKVNLGYKPATDYLIDFERQLPSKHLPLPNRNFPHWFHSRSKSV